MARVDDLTNLFCCRSHGRSVRGCEIDLIDIGSVGEIPGHAIGNQDAVFCDLRLSEGVDSFLEAADYSKRQRIEHDGASGRDRCETVQFDCQTALNDGNFAAGCLVARVEESSRKELQVAHRSVLGEDSKDTNVLLLTVSYWDAVIQL